MRTKIFYPRSRIIRFPFDVRGKCYIDFGIGLTTGIGCRIEAFSNDNSKTLHIGTNVQINDYVHICAMKNVSIGDNVLIAGKVYISDNSHGSYKGDANDTSPEIEPVNRSYPTQDVIIGANVWLGESVVVLPGVHIGQGAIVGANSVVSKSIPPYTISVGQPGRVIKRYNFETKKWEKIID